MNELDEACDLIKRFEGCRLKAYQDVVGVWTIGFGETLGVKEGMIWTQDYADARLRIRVRYFMAEVLKRCPTLSGNSLVACTSLAYNIGLGAFGVSSVCRLSKARDWFNAANAFLLWNKSGGKAWRGLTNRRINERLIFLSPVFLEQ